MVVSQDEAPGRRGFVADPAQPPGRMQPQDELACSSAQLLIDCLPVMPGELHREPFPIPCAEILRESNRLLIAVPGCTL
jgi:hypothetical protein